MMKLHLRLRYALLLFAVLVVIAGCASAHLTQSSAMIIEVATFKLKPGVTPEAFRPFDQAVETQHIAKQPGFISRESAASDDGEWLVIVHWRSVADAEASMQSFSSAPAAAEFMAHLQPETMQMKTYRTE